MSSTITSGSCHAAVPPIQQSMSVPSGAVDGGGSGAPDAAPGSGGLSPDALVPVLQAVVGVISALVPILQQLAGGAIGGGVPGSPGQHCSMPSCPLNGAVQGAMGAMGAPSAAVQAVEGASDAAPSSVSGADAGPDAPRPVEVGSGPGSSSEYGGTSGDDAGSSDGPSAPGAESSGDAPARAAATVDPSSVQDKSSTKGLSAAAMRGLDEAHKFGLPLVSGHRPGGSSKSDHSHGKAIDVSTTKIGDASSTEGTPEMKAFAEHMRTAGMNSELNVKYVIADGKIASKRDGWAWRDYTYPGKSDSELASLKESNRGEYNRIQHYDHVHVSFK